MKVSVVIPTYNRAQYICEAVESVFQQTMKDVEIIVVDDGSTDGTPEMMKKYEHRLKYVYTRNGGPAHARNVGMKMAEGEYIAWLDSDDLYYPYKLQLQVDFLDQFKNMAMVCSEFSAFDDVGFWEECHLKNYHKALLKPGLQYSKIFSRALSLQDAGLSFDRYGDKKIYMGNIYKSYFREIIIFTNSILFRREVLEKVGFLNERYWMFQDLEFVLRMTKHYELAFIDVPTYKLRYHSAQISDDTKKKDGLQVTIRKQSELLEIAKTHGLKDEAFYTRNKLLVHETLSVLHKALVIPLIAKGNEIARVRDHLKRSADYGHPSYFFWLLSFCPYLFQRVVLKVLSISEQVKFKWLRSFQIFIKSWLVLWAPELFIIEMDFLEVCLNCFEY